MTNNKWKSATATTTTAAAISVRGPLDFEQEKEMNGKKERQEEQKQFSTRNENISKIDCCSLCVFAHDLLVLALCRCAMNFWFFCRFFFRFVHSILCVLFSVYIFVIPLRWLSILLSRCYVRLLVFFALFPKHKTSNSKWIWNPKSRCIKRLKMI